MRREPEGSSRLQILVALDTRSDILAAMRSAAALAARMQGELLGLFVEDTDLLRVADLPFAHEIMIWSARERRLTEGDMARSLRALAARAQTELARTAQEARIQWSFRVQRGPRMQLLMEAGGAFDLVFVAATRRNAGPGLADTRRVRQSTEVYTLFTGSPASDRSLSAAIAMVRDTAGVLNVLVAAKDPDAVRAARDEVMKQLEGEDLVAKLTDYPGDRAADLVRTLVGLTGSALFLPADLGLSGDPDAFRDLLDRINCPVVLVR